MKAKAADFFITSVVALEKATLLCMIVSDTSIGMITPPQALSPRICPGAESRVDCLK